MGTGALKHLLAATKEAFCIRLILAPAVAEICTPLRTSLPLARRRFHRTSKNVVPEAISTKHIFCCWVSFAFSFAILHSAHLRLHGWHLCEPPSILFLSKQRAQKTNVFDLCSIGELTYSSGAVKFYHDDSKSKCKKEQTCTQKGTILTFKRCPISFLASSSNAHMSLVQQFDEAVRTHDDAQSPSHLRLVLADVAPSSYHTPFSNTSRTHYRSRTRAKAQLFKSDKASHIRVVFCQLSNTTGHTRFEKAPQEQTQTGQGNDSKRPSRRN